MISPERLVAELDTLIIGRQKRDHVTWTCPHTTDRHHEVDTAAVPPNHIELCLWCREYLEGEYGECGLAAECQRCGRKLDARGLCEVCRRVRRRRRARRRL